MKKVLGSNLIPSLRDKYGIRSLGVVKGDTIKVLRGEYVGIEGKVEKVNTERATLSIEGVQREKIRGGNVKVQIHASNVQIISLNTDDEFRIKGTQKSKDKKTPVIKEKEKQVETKKPITKAKEVVNGEET